VTEKGTLKMQDWKMRDRNAGVTNEGPSRYGKPNVALSNVYPHCQVCVAVFPFGFQRCLYAPG